MQNILEFVLTHYSPNINRAAQCSLPQRSGKKPGHQTGKRNTQHARDTSGWDDMYLFFFFLRSTKATTCYGCGGKVREKSSSDPPPAPYGILLCRYERRDLHRKKRGFSQNTLNISKEVRGGSVLLSSSNWLRNLGRATLIIYILKPIFRLPSPDPVERIWD